MFGSGAAKPKRVPDWNKIVNSHEICCLDTLLDFTRHRIPEPRVLWNMKYGEELYV